MLSRIETNIRDLNSSEVFKKIEELSHLCAEDVEMIARFCLANDVIIAIRTPGDRVRHLLEQGYYGKGLTIKAKTADIGPIILQGLLPVNQQFSKLINKEDHVFAKLQKELNNKLEEDAKKIAYMKDEVQEGCDYRDIARLQLIIEQPLLNEKGQQLYGILNNNYEAEGVSRYIFAYHNQNLNIEGEPIEAIPITIAAYVTDIVMNEREEIEVHAVPITSDYDLALIACRSNEVNFQSPAVNLRNLYPAIDKFSKEEQSMLNNRGLGTILDHVVLAALVTHNLSINHAPDTGNPHPEGLHEPWVAILPQYDNNHPLHCSDANDKIIISNLPDSYSKESFFCYLKEMGYNFPFNPQWVAGGFNNNFEQMLHNEGEPLSLNFIAAPHIDIQIAERSFVSVICNKICGFDCIRQFI